VPAAVDLAHDGVITELEVVEELLAELDRAVHLLDAPQRDAFAVDGHHEHRQPFVLGHIPVGAGQHQAVVGGERAGAPGLGAVDHPLVAFAVGAGDDACEIRPAAGLRQELHEHLITAQCGRDVLLLLLFGSGVEDCRGADGEGRGVQDDRHFVAA
jgi:hypothetical protein